MNETAAALASAKREIAKLRKAITEKFIKLAQEVEKLESAVPLEESREFLMTRCGMVPSEIRTCSQFSRKLKGYEQFLQDRAVPYEVVRGLIATNATVREMAIARIASGVRFDLKDLRAVRRYVADSKMSDFEHRANASKKSLLDAARRRSIVAVDEFRNNTAALLDKIAELPCARTVAASSKQMSSIAKDASRLLPAFEAIAGSTHPIFGQPGWREAKELERRAGEVHRLLQSLSTPKGKARNEMAHRAERLMAGRASAIGKLARYVGNEDYMSMFRPLDDGLRTTLPERRLKALEICAGAGGMALGLERAGFDHVGLVEFNRDAAATMRLNRPNWPVIEQDLTTIDFTQFAGKVDLVCGGPPCQAFSEEGIGLGKDDGRDLLLEGARAVREIKPKAFVFENVRGALFGKHGDHIAAFLKELGEAGYVTQIVEVNTADYGVAQNRPRILFVGLKAYHARRFEMPRFPKRRANVGDVLYDLMAANGWSEVDDWAEYCRTVTFELDDGTVLQGAQASTLTGRKGKAQEKERIRWARNGLTPAGVPDEAPTDELARKLGPDFVPGLTLRMRGRLQDFDDIYVFVGGKASVAKQIGNAVAPRMAQAIGLALHSVLTGYRFDMEALLWPHEGEHVRARAVVEPPSLFPELTHAIVEEA